MKRKRPKLEYGIFCEVYGKNIRNLVIEFLVENQGVEFAIGDMAKELNISRPKAYEKIDEFEKKDLVKKSRIVSGTQLYLLNEKNRISKLWIKNFKECLKIVIEESEEKPNYSASSSISTISAKGF